MIETVKQRNGKNIYHIKDDKTGVLQDRSLTRVAARKMNLHHNNKAALVRHPMPSNANALMQHVRAVRQRLKLSSKAVWGKVPHMQASDMSAYEFGRAWPQCRRLNAILKLVGLKLALIDTSDGTVWDVSGDQPLPFPTQRDPTRMRLLGPRNGTSSEHPSSQTDTSPPSLDHP